MRNVNRVNTARPGELNSEECRNHLNHIINTPNIDALPDYYRGKRINQDGSIEYTVRDSLKALYKNKCAYCEKLSHAPRVDHHRPKGRVVGTGALNNGYYWLCYEWTNLLPSCTDCNSIEAKGSKYPVNGNRNNAHPVSGNPPTPETRSFAYDSIFNTSESPLLLHPEYCIAQNNFRFDKDGKIIGITVEGIRTISDLKLDNPDLNGWRKKIYIDHLSDMRNIVRKRFRTNIPPISANHFSELIYDWTEKLVLQANDDMLEYTLFRKYLLKQLEDFFISELDIVFQQNTREEITSAILTLSV